MTHYRQLQLAVAWWPYAPWLGDLALLEMRFAGGTDAAVWQALARQHLRAALVRQPIEPYGWYRLALLERADRLTAARDMLASMLSGPNEPSLLWLRLPLALELAPELNSLAPGIVDEQLRAAWVQPKRARAAVSDVPVGLAHAVKDR